MLCIRFKSHFKSSNKNIPPSGKGWRYIFLVVVRQNIYKRRLYPDRSYECQCDENIKFLPEIVKKSIKVIAKSNFM